MTDKEKLPTLTLVTPTRNQAEFIEATLKSIDSQGYPALEHMVMDACSTDGTSQILDAHRRPWRRVICETDRGQSDAINKGMRMGSGEIAGWLNSDDLLYPGALRAIGEAFLAYPDASVVYGWGAKIARDGGILREVPFRPFDREVLRTAFRILQPSLFFRREEFLKVGGLDIALEYAMDWELLLRLSKGRSVVAIPEPIGKLRCYEDTKTSLGGWARMREIAEIGKRYHGMSDPNYISFCLRRIVGRSRSVALQKATDYFLWKLFHGKPLMVEGWP